MHVSKLAGKRPTVPRYRPVPAVSRLVLCGMVVVGTSVCVPGRAISQTTPAPASATDQPAPAKHHKKTEAPPVPEPPPQPTVAPSLLQEPAAPATVTANNNELTVKAHNSSLSQILHQVSSATGMKLDGLGGDERVFGSFGPGAPQAADQRCRQ